MIDCCIVGGGPGGVLLSYLLSRAGLRVCLLEAAQDFDRDFRGDALIPGSMEMLHHLGLADGVLGLRHSKIQRIVVETENGPLKVSDYTGLPSRFPFTTVVPQVKFLDYLVGQARGYSGFEVRMGANVRELIKDSHGRVIGVQYLENGETKELHANLTVGVDGRFSRLRHVSDLELVRTSPPMDILWFRLPRLADEPASRNLSVRVGRGFYTALTDRFDYWQLALVIPKGSYKEMKSQGIETLHRAVVESVPEFADRVEHLDDWSKVSRLRVNSNRLRKWFLPGFLMLGDAAHTMSSIGGVGIHCALEDAIVATNVLARPLRDNRLRTAHLLQVQVRRELPIRVLQFLQGVAQNWRLNFSLEL